MSYIENHFTISIATVNGSGSQTANGVLLRSLFRMGIPVGGKNVFPSNISGMPTWFWIRANAKGYVGATQKAEIVLSLNPQTLLQDQELVKSGGFFFYQDHLKSEVSFRDDIVAVALPFKSLAERIQAAPKVKKLASNMIYVGILSLLFKIPQELVSKVLTQQLEGKTSAMAANQEAFAIGVKFAEENLTNLKFPYRATMQTPFQDRVLMDGNTAAAFGLISGGCQFISWYPITPSTSVVESFAAYAEKLCKDENGKNKYAIVQAEDELSAFSMVLGAGWAGTRAMTATSGPGLSLMAEAAGYAYYAEIPSVIWNVQRLGPSTGLPTRTAQGDVLSSAFLSHGDTKHILLFPANLEESFVFGQTCFDLAERLQQLVIVLSDLDLAMNLWMGPVLRPLETAYDRGLVLCEKELDQAGFHRYADSDGSGIAPRTVLGNTHPQAAYFTRGSGHNHEAQYSEKASDYEKNVLRLERKMETAKTLVPKPIVQHKSAAIGLIYYGSSDAIIEELCELMQVSLNLCRIRAFPFSAEVFDFIDSCEQVFVIEQNRDAQLKKMLCMEPACDRKKIKSLVHFDGTPISADSIAQKLKNEIAHV